MDAHCRLKLLRLGYVIVAVSLLAGCGWRLSPPPGLDPVNSVAGTVTVTGPVPIFEQYDGDQPLLAQISVGLFRRGSDTLELPGYISNIQSSFLPLNLHGTLPFHLEFPDRAAPPGEYELALYARTPGTAYTKDVEPYTPRVISARLPLTLAGHGSQQSGQSLSVSFSGPAPHASLGGALLLSGSPENFSQLALLLSPEHAQPGLESARLIWNLDSGRIRHGLLEYEVPGLAIQSYELSYSGLRLRDRNDFLSVGAVTVELAAGIAAVAPVLRTSSAGGPRPWGSSVVSGRLLLSAAPSRNFYAIEATAANADGPAAAAAVCCLAAADFDSSGPVAAAYRLAWLQPGEYTLSAYALGSVAAEDVLLTSSAVLSLPPAGIELSAVDLEVQP